MSSAVQDTASSSGALSRIALRQVDRCPSYGIGGQSNLTMSETGQSQAELCAGQGAV